MTTSLGKDMSEGLGRRAYDLLIKTEKNLIPHFILPDEFWHVEDEDPWPTHAESFFCLYPFDTFTVSFESYLTIVPDKIENGIKTINRMSFSKQGNDIMIMNILFVEERFTNVLAFNASFDENGYLLSLKALPPRIEDALGIISLELPEGHAGVFFNSLVKFSHALSSRSYIISEPSSISRQQRRIIERKNIQTPRKVILAPHISLRESRRMIAASRKAAIKIFKRAHPVRAHERIWEGKNGEIKITTVRSHIRGGKHEGGRTYDATKLGG